MSTAFIPIDPYIDNTDAQAYFDNMRFVTDAWDNASPTQQQKALVEASNRIDRLNFTGLRTADANSIAAGLDPDNPGVTISNVLLPSNPSSGQLREFPRNGETVVPQDILAACCEIAYALLDGVDAELEMLNLSTVQHGFAALQETYDPRIVNLAFKHGIPSMTAWNFLLPYLQDPWEIATRRVS